MILCVRNLKLKKECIDRSDIFLLKYQNFPNLKAKKQCLFPSNVREIQQFKMRNFFQEDEDLPTPGQDNMGFFIENVSSPLKMEMFALEEKQAQKSDDYTSSLFFISQYLSIQGQEMSSEDRQEDSSFQEILKNSIYTFPQNLPLKPVRKQKQKKKGYVSPFHNFQKHLSNYLKNVVVIPPFRESEEEYMTVARAIWEIFLQEKSKTKLVLHLVFNGNSQRPIKGETLRNFGFVDLYRRYSDDVVNRAKSYLGMLAIEQIEPAELSNYLNTRKIQKNEGLHDYILGFRSELKRGHMKRRIKMGQLQF